MYILEVHFFHIKFQPKNIPKPLQKKKKKPPYRYSSNVEKMVVFGFLSIDIANRQRIIDFFGSTNNLY